MILKTETYTGISFGIAYSNDKPRKKYIVSIGAGHINH